MPQTYRHTQIGLALRVACMLGAVPMILAGALVGKALLLAPLALLFAALGWCFGALTVEVTRAELVWHFGGGLWRNSVARTDIVSATAETNPWWYGWGIHRTPHGWLYNVAGLRAVEVSLRDGTSFRIGSDEPERLARMLQPFRPTGAASAHH